MAYLAFVLLLHPGHMTRIELRASDDAKSIEVGMRIDASDLESALKARLKKPVDLASLSQDDAARFLSDYLRETITINREKLSKDQFRWVGWERHPRHAWIFFELAKPQSAGKTEALDLRVRTLFEVEPALQHVVVLGENLGNRTKIVSDPEQPISLMTTLPVTPNTTN